MKELINWMTNVFAPKASKISKNPWIASVQDSMVAIMPFILISSVVTMISIIKDYAPGFPDISYISNFSFGLSSLFIAFLIPTGTLEKLRLNKYRRQAGAMGVALFIMLVVPTFDEAGNIVIEFSRLGSGSMFVAIIAGLFTAWIMKLFSKKSLFKKDTLLPKFLVDSFDSMLPIIVIMVLSYLLMDLFKLNLYSFINIALSPLINIAQSFGGFVLIIFLISFFYTFGLSTALLAPVFYTVWFQGIAVNAENVAKGLSATYINTWEVFTGWLALGGTGCTLVLCILLLFAKSSKLKGIGKTCIVPSIFNINEPLIFGTVVFNPLFMIPVWICNLVLPAITYIAFSSGLVTIPYSVFQIWYIPAGIQTFLINHDVRGLVLLAIILVLSFVIYYPFFKVYDNQCVKEEEALRKKELEGVAHD